MEKKDSGHIALVDDVSALEEDAKNFEFHDFKSPSNPMPKVALVDRLNEILNKVLTGKYDN